MKNKFFIHFRYGLFSGRYYLLASFILFFLLGMILAYGNAINFHNWYVDYIKSNEISFKLIYSTKAAYAYNFWESITPYIALLLVPLSAFLISADNENEMNKYLLLYERSNLSLYGARISLLLLISLVGTLLTWLIYNLIFNYITGFWVFYPRVLVSLFALFSIFLLFGGFIGNIIGKKSWSIIISILVIIVLLTLGQMAYNQGINSVNLLNINNVDEFRNAFPMGLKILMFFSPYSLYEINKILFGFPQSLNVVSEISILGFWGDVMAYII